MTDKIYTKETNRHIRLLSRPMFTVAYDTSAAAQAPPRRPDVWIIHKGASFHRTPNLLQQSSGLRSLFTQNGILITVIDMLSRYLCQLAIDRYANAFVLQSEPMTSFSVHYKMLVRLKFNFEFEIYDMRNN